MTIARALAAALVLLASPALACGPDSPCNVAGGEYRIRMPERADGPVGAVMFFHGWKGTAAGEMRNKSLGRQIEAEGLAFIAVQGKGRTWSYPSSPSQRRDEFAFIDAVLDDVTTRFPIAADRIMASGFSMGGSMVWYLACKTPGRFAGFAPIAGAFWRPHPDACSGGPLPTLLHVHGTADQTVPLGGRPIGASHHQGDVFESLAQLRREAGVADVARTYEEGPLSCRLWADRLELCLHGGGHSIRAEWVVRAWRKLAALKGWRTG